MPNKPTEKEIDRGYKRCEICSKGIILLQAGFEVSTSSCTQCGEHVANSDEFFNVPVNTNHIRQIADKLDELNSK